MSIFVIFIALFFIICFLVPLTVGLVLLIVFRSRKKARSEAAQPVQTAPSEAAESSRSLAEILKDHRIQSGMTQELVAEKLNISRQAVSKWESGASEPSTANLLALSKLYDIDPGELLKDIQI